MKLDISTHKTILFQILKDIYSNTRIAPFLGFKGGTAALLFYGLDRFSVDMLLWVAWIVLALVALAGLTGVFPLVARLSNGNSVIVVGARKEEGGEAKVAVLDPLADRLLKAQGRWDAIADLLARMAGMAFAEDLLKSAGTVASATSPRRSPDDGRKRGAASPRMNTKMNETAMSGTTSDSTCQASTPPESSTPARP